jgi:peptidoglycan/xylan/chitin deacetylase (PgdA/CDA1 family)
MKRRLAAVGVVFAVLFLAVWILSASASKKKLHTTRVSSGVRTILRGERAAAQVARQNRAIEQLLETTPRVRRLPAAGSEVALTFDDGPSPYTEAIIDTLLHYRAPATFFPIGLAIEEHPATIRREVNDGFAIGDHTVNHARMTDLPPAEQQAELLDQAEDLKALGAPYPRLFRPPFGVYDAATLRLLREKGMLMVLWTVETDDYELPGAEAIATRVLEEVSPGAIVLMHDGGGDRSETVAALPQIIEGLRDRGYRLVTVPQLVLDASR